MVIVKAEVAENNESDPLGFPVNVMGYIRNSMINRG
jgi:hypothetical protein